jgi:membrane protein required for colicin V production
VTLTILDIAVIAVIAISAILALFRGFVREMFSIAGWIGAGVAVYFLLPIVRPHAQKLVHDPLIAGVAAGVVIFVVALFVISLIGAAVAPKIRAGGLAATDRTLGLAFGVVRGFFLVSLTYIPLLWLYSAKHPPVWIKDAVTRPMLETGAQYIKRVAPADMFNRGRQATRRAANDAKLIRRATSNE